MPRRNRPAQPVWGPRRTGKTARTATGSLVYQITHAGPRFRTRNVQRAMKVTSARLALQQGVA